MAFIQGSLLIHSSKGYVCPDWNGNQKPVETHSKSAYIIIIVTPVIVTMPGVIKDVIILYQ